MLYRCLCGSQIMAILIMYADAPGTVEKSIDVQVCDATGADVCVAAGYIRIKTRLLGRVQSITKVVCFHCFCCRFKDFLFLPIVPFYWRRLLHQRINISHANQIPDAF